MNPPHDRPPSGAGFAGPRPPGSLPARRRPSGARLAGPRPPASLLAGCRSLGNGRVGVRPLAGRAVLVARAGWGLGALVAPGAVGRVLGLAPDDGRARLLLRFLGARDLGQAVLAATAPPPALARLGVGVDVLHAASMYALAALSRDYRRPALTAAAIATAWTATTGLARDGRTPA